MSGLGRVIFGKKEREFIEFLNSYCFFRVFYRVDFNGVVILWFEWELNK